MRCQADWEAPIRPLARGAPPRGADAQLNGPVRGSLSAMRAAQFVGVCGARSMWHGAAARRERRGRSTPPRTCAARSRRRAAVRRPVSESRGRTAALRRDSFRPTSLRPAVPPANTPPPFASLISLKDLSEGPPSTSTRSTGDASASRLVVSLAGHELVANIGRGCRDRVTRHDIAS